MSEEGKFSAPELELLLNNSGNEVCCDCKGKNPYWSSINNGVLLCAKCTRKHRKYGNRISKIKSLEVDKWDKREILFLQLGGNLRFNNLMSEYNIPLTKNNQEYKYYTKIAEYYRNFLKSQVLSENFLIEKPSLEEGIKRIDNNENEENDFNNINNCYSFEQNENNNNDNKNNNNNIDNENNNALENNLYKNMNENKIEIKNPDINSNNYLYPDSSHINLGNDWNNLLSSMGKLWNNVGSKISSKVRDFDFDSKKKASI